MEQRAFTLPEVIKLAVRQR